MKYTGYFTIVILLLSTSANSQTLSTDWKQVLATTLQEFSSCKPTATSMCIKYPGEILNAVYKVNDFYSQKTGKYMTASEIAAFLKGTDTWSLVGHAYEQNALATAQLRANEKKAVVAVYMGASGLGHVVLITPGELQASGSWGLNVPLAASFFQPQPDKSFINKALSFAFPKNIMKDVFLYVKSY